MKRKIYINYSPDKRTRINVESLTDLILTKIFLFTLLSDFRSIALTCKRFRDLSMESLRYALRNETRAVGGYLERYIEECVNTGKELIICHLFKVDTFNVGFHMKNLYEYQLKTGNVDISLALFRLGRLDMKTSKFVCGCLILLMKRYKGLVIELISQANVLGDGHVNWNYPIYGGYSIIASYHHEELLRLCLQEGRAIMTERDLELFEIDFGNFGDVYLHIALNEYLVKRSDIIQNQMALGYIYCGFCDHTEYDYSTLYNFGSSCDCDRPTEQ